MRPSARISFSLSRFRCSPSKHSMKRPLALAGVLYLAVQLLATFQPPAALAPLAVLFVLGAICAEQWGGKHRAPLLLCCLVSAAALILRLATESLWIAPIQSRAGQQVRTEASVVETSAGYTDNTVRAMLLIETVDGVRVRPFRVSCGQLPYTEPGERITACLQFVPLPSDEYRYSRYADGCFLAAEYGGDFSVIGESGALWAHAARIRKALSGRLFSCMEQPYAGMAAAMTVGDRTHLTDEVRSSVRKAGLSHILVVSGLHLSAVSGLVYLLLRRVTGLYAASAGAMASVAGFMLLTGFTPSVLRAGIAMLLFYAGALLHRRSDGVTSLGTAALILCIANPYAAVDAGFLLSCLATFGVLCASDARRRSSVQIERAGQPRAKGVFRYVMHSKLLWPAVTTAAAALMTLPVLICMGSGVSLLSVVSSLLILPVMPVTVGTGFITALCAGVPWLGVAERAAGDACTLTLRWTLAVARMVSSQSYFFVHISGAFAMCVSLLLCLLVWAAWEWHIPVRRAAASCLAFCVLCAGIYAAMDVDVVRIFLAGSGANPAVVILQGLHTAVLYRGPATNAAAVWDILEMYNRTGVDFLVDLRRDGDTEALAQTLAARDSVCVETELLNHAVYAPFGDVLLYVRRQTKGSFACLEVRGIRVGVASGAVQLDALPALNCFIAGSAQPEGLRCTELIVPKPQSCTWLDAVKTRRVYGRAEIILRAGASLTIHEVTNAVEWTSA